jgi:hypothetical protein
MRLKFAGNQFWIDWNATGFAQKKWNIRPAEFEA